MAFSPSASSAIIKKSLDLDMMSSPLFTPISEPIAGMDMSNTISAATVDPTTALSQILAGLLGSPAILAVPILAAVSVASLLAFFIVSYANPADPDE
eukprot:CAMPEP_0197253990 /NCGR_PEP_ID=MMETSP1429-20130617/66985_1 /TAXON_ID=49237 /ORGANISM="Chaetoceros  sp., Strain UNC1202" /LENGTH=96 /DNA_ID=CAMNT_0042716839 /DNA_START=125 /DNA_END=415 /DNA_ORIENTATION=+